MGLRLGQVLAFCLRSGPRLGLGKRLGPVRDRGRRRGSRRGGRTRDRGLSTLQDFEALKQKFPKDYKVIRPYLRLTSQPNKSWP